MLNKSNILKDYLNNIGTKNQLFFLFGHMPTPSTSNTSQSAIDSWKNSEMSYKVGRRDSIAVVPANIWKSGYVYDYWKSKQINTGNYYALNKTNNIVYLCISNNSLDRKDLSMSSASTQIPNHEYGIKKYKDGYSWLALYRITTDMNRFLNNTWMPVISFDDYRQTNISKYNSAEKFCPQSQASTVYCGIYFKENTQIETTSGTFTTYEKGTLYTSIRTECQKCYYLFENDDRYETLAYVSSTDVLNSITIKDKFDQIEELVSTNQISTSSPYYSLYQMSKNGLEDGAIVSAMLDLTGFDTANLVVDTPNPEITVSSSSGSGAKLIFTTYVNLDGENIINGVSLITNGRNYKNPVLSINYSIFPYLTSTQVDELISSIEVNVDNLDGLNFDPISALSAENIMFDIRVETNVLKQQNLSIPRKINFYALVENPIEILDDTIEIVAGSQYGKDDTYIEKTTAKVKLTATPTILDPEEELSGTLTLVDGRVVQNVNVLGVEVAGATTSAELNNFNYVDIDEISTVTIDSVVYTVDEVVYKPSFKQYSGKIAQTKTFTNDLKFGNANTDSENTRIFRINIVKGF
jgi:hypothetical protein